MEDEKLTREQLIARAKELLAEQEASLTAMSDRELDEYVDRLLDFVEW